MFNKSFKQDAVITAQSGLIDASRATGTFNLPKGTTAQRPTSGVVVGATRWNTTLNALECYVGSNTWQTITSFALNGSTAAQAAPSAVYLTNTLGLTTNGVYWINLPTVGPTQVYCILDRNYAGGGWMMAMKGTRGTTFNYGASYWTTANTLNPSDTTRNDGDAKFDVYNYFAATDWMAIFPDVGTGGDLINIKVGGWSWVDTNAVGSTTPVLTFMNTNTQVVKLSNGVIYAGTSPIPANSQKFVNGPFSDETGFQFYGYNYQGNASWKTRWGWAWNNEADQSSNDIGGGIGMQAQNYSAGDYVGCCAVYTGVNRSMRFEWYVR